MSGSIGRGGFSINYGLRQHDNSVYLYIQDDWDAFDALHEQKDEIEADFGAPLEWRAEAGQRSRSIVYPQEGGYRSPAEEWSAIQDGMIDALIRLDRVMRPRVQALRH